MSLPDNSLHLYQFRKKGKLRQNVELVNKVDIKELECTLEPFKNHSLNLNNSYRIYFFNSFCNFKHKKRNLITDNICCCL